MMGTYEVVMAVILLFPWSLFAVMIGGCAWQRVRGLRHLQLPRWRPASGSRGVSSAGLSPDGSTVAQAAACR
jgi:hypothetical protein